MNTLPTPSSSDSVTADKQEESAQEQASFREQMQQVEELTNTLKRVLVRYENTLEEEGIRDHIATLERWTESYRHGLSAAHKISEHAPAWLAELKDRLKLTADELHRLEAEGGCPTAADEADKADDLLGAASQIDQVIPAVEQMFPQTPGADKESEHV